MRSPIENKQWEEVKPDKIVNMIQHLTAWTQDVIDYIKKKQKLFRNLNKFVLPTTKKPGETKEIEKQYIQKNVMEDLEKGKTTETWEHMAYKQTQIIRNSQRKLWHILCRKNLS